MTSIYLKRRKNHYEISVQGHAEYSAAGDDIVCAAISVLSYTLMQSLRDAEEEGIIRYLHQQIESGDIRAEFESLHHGTADTIINTILCGYRMVEAQYASNCKILLDADPGGEKAF